MSNQPDQPSDRKVPTGDVAAKVEWEGGLVETIGYYGLPASEIADPHLAELWAMAARVFNELLRPVLEEIEGLLDAAVAADEGEG